MSAKWKPAIGKLQIEFVPHIPIRKSMCRQKINAGDVTW